MPRAAALLPLLLFLGPAAAAPGRTIRVSDDAEFRRALAAAEAGTVILVSPGRYRGGIHAEGLAGREDEPIVVAGADPKDPPVIVGGGSGLQFSRATHLEIRDLVLEGATGNGLNIDDGGKRDGGSHHITVRRVVVRDVGPRGNCDGIKLSGLTNFVVEEATVVRWGDGGSAVDMVGCHEGEIRDSTFRHEPPRGGSGVQAKGGSRDVTIRRCRFFDAGQRAVNLGGSTGQAFFRPPEPGHEAKDLVVEDCVFSGGGAPVAFVGVDGAVFRHNVIWRPKGFVLRILQETRLPGFVPSREGRFEKNIVVWRAADVRAIANVGDATAPETFAFTGNFWFCEDEPPRSRPSLPTAEKDGRYGDDPRFADPENGDFSLKKGSPATGRGPRP